MEYLKVGKIVTNFSFKGEVKIFVTSSFASKRFKKGSVLYLKTNDQYKELNVEKSFKKDEKFYVVKFKEINSEDEAKSIINNEIFALKNNEVLEQNQYFYADLAGLLVKNEENLVIGKVVSIVDYTPQIQLEIEQENKKKFMVPFNDFFITKIDLENKEIIIHVIEGLL